MGVVDLGRLPHRTTRLQLPQSNRLDKRTDNKRVLVQRQGVADMLMGPQEVDHLGGGSLPGEGEALHPSAHNPSLSHKDIPNNVGGVHPPSYKEEGEGSILADVDEGEVKYRRQPLDLVPLYLHNTNRVFVA